MPGTGLYSSLNETVCGLCRPRGGLLREGPAKPRSLPEFSPGRGNTQSQGTCEKAGGQQNEVGSITNPMCPVHSICPAPLAGGSMRTVHVCLPTAHPPPRHWPSTLPSSWCIRGLKKDLLRKQGNVMSCGSGIVEYLEVSRCPQGPSLRDQAALEQGMSPSRGGWWGPDASGRREGYGRVKCTTWKGPSWWEDPSVSLPPWFQTQVEL